MMLHKKYSSSYINSPQKEDPLPVVSRHPHTPNILWSDSRRMVYVVQRKAPPPLVSRLTRSGSAAPDTQAVEARSGPIGAAVKSAVANSGCVTLITICDEHGTASYVVTPPADRTGYVVGAVSSAVGAKATAVESAPDIASRCVGWLVARPTETASRATQHGGDQSEIAILLGRILHPGEWVAATIRPPTKAEIRNSRRWFDHRLRTPVTHYSKDSGLVVVSIFAGADDDDQVANLLSQIASAIPGFDVEVKVQTRPAIIPLTVSALVATGAGAGVGIGSHHPVFGLLAGAGVLLASIVSRIVPTPARATAGALDRATAADQIPPPPVRHVPVGKPVRKDVARTVNGQVQSRHVENHGGYPLAGSSFIIRPAMILGLVSPHAGTASGMADTQSRTIPAALLEDIGPIIGHAITGAPNPAHIDAGELYGGVFISGIPGSGKTVLVNHIWAWNVLDRVRPSHKPGRPGRNNAIIAFESKGEGTSSYRRWSDSFGDRTVEVSLSDASTPAIDVAEPSLPAGERARVIVSAMTAAFNKGDIQAASSKALTAVITAGLLCPKSVSASVLEGPSSYMRVAHVLLTGEGDDRANEMFKKLSDYAQELQPTNPARQEFNDALGRLDYISPNVTSSARRSIVAAPENKIDLLMQAPHWWSDTRPHAPWSQVLNNHSSVIVNSGVDQYGQQLDPALSTVIMSMSAYALRDAIQRNCSGWAQSGRSVTVFSDELAVLVQSSAEVIEWLRDAGRSYGVRLVLATQRPEQIPTTLRSALRNFGTTIWFRQSDPVVVGEILSLLSMDGSAWDSNDLVGLGPWQAILRATAGGRMQPPVPIQTAYWGDGDTAQTRFASDNGYGVEHVIGR